MSVSTINIVARKTIPFPGEVFGRSRRKHVLQKANSGTLYNLFDKEVAGEEEMDTTTDIESHTKKEIVRAILDRLPMMPLGTKSWMKFTTRKNSSKVCSPRKKVTRSRRKKSR
jgi:hypothetical protein